tara:strand:+ start:1842 stop:2159 length:318 start_codon:yes stop_codon:yes gene_type:complete
MRWLSSFAILVYLSLLCSPQALASHDSRLSPLADTQLQALTHAPHYASAATLADNDDPPPVALLAANPADCHYRSPQPLASIAALLVQLSYTRHQPRAPPRLSSH